MSLVFNMVSGGAAGGGLKDTDAVLIVTVPTGSTVTATKGGTTLTPTMWVKAADASLDCAIFSIPASQFDSTTPWTVTATDGANTASDTVLITTNKEYETEILYLLPAEYQQIEYIGIGASGGAWLHTGHNFTINDEFEIKQKYDSTPNTNSWFFGAYVGTKQTDVGYTNDNIYIQTGGRNVSKAFDTNIHVYKSTRYAFAIDGAIVSGATPNWQNTTTIECHLFYIGDGAYSNNCRIYYAKIWTSGVLDAYLIPCYRKADSVPGVYDLVNATFYSNAGTGSFIVGTDL